MGYIDKVSIDGLVYDVQDTNTKVKVENVDKDLKALEEVVDGVNSVVGSEDLTTESKTLKGAINELDSAITELGESSGGGSGIGTIAADYSENKYITVGAKGYTDVELLSASSPGVFQNRKFVEIFEAIIPDGCGYYVKTVSPTRHDHRAEANIRVFNYTDNTVEGGVRLRFKSYY